MRVYCSRDNFIFSSENQNTPTIHKTSSTLYNEISLNNNYIFRLNVLKKRNGYKSNNCEFCEIIYQPFNSLGDWTCSGKFQKNSSHGYLGAWRPKFYCPKHESAYYKKKISTQVETIYTRPTAIFHTQNTQ